MKIPRKTKGAKAFRLRNAYGLNPAKEYNARTSAPHPTGMKMYAELTGIKNGKNHGIKSLWDNNLWTSIMFNGIPFLADTSCPANHLFFLNEEQLHLKVITGRDMKFVEKGQPINQDVDVGQVYWMGAFGSSNNRCHGKFSALTA